MEEIRKPYNVNFLGVGDLERLVAGFPWYSHARQVLLYKLAQMGEECFEQKFRDYAAFLPSRETIYYKTRDIISGKISVDITEKVNIIEDIIVSESREMRDDNMGNINVIVDGNNKTDVIEEEPAMDFDDIKNIEIEEISQMPIEFELESKPQVYVLGGDYFTRADFELLKSEERIEKVGSFVSKERNEPLISYTNQEPIMSTEDFDSPEFFTETLAKIYTEQGYYEQAINVYAKLILLYPEKSTYFATLVDEIKSKN